MVRFVNGHPDTVYYSEHASGSAYKYSTVEKIGDRPVNYIAIGTHANYPVRSEPRSWSQFHIITDLLASRNLETKTTSISHLTF